ncbi:P-loop containing nucleoside triphosphate hydrolase protein [Chiua virens]|nr:P-loop containing nucleoside triphosphate hydrolase protein [Chiua virens]
MRNSFSPRAIPVKSLNMTVSLQSVFTQAESSTEYSTAGDEASVPVAIRQQIHPMIQRQDITTILELTIESIQAINDLIPIAMAKNILTGITRILLLFQKCINNKDDLKGLVRRCEDVCSTLAQATRGVSMDQISDVLLGALSTLESSIDELHSKVKETLQHGRVRRFFSANLDEKQINSWSTELDRIFGTFNTKLNINSGIRLEQVYYILMHPEVRNLIPDPPPSPPAMFFGREELFSQVKDALLHDKDVALIGPGGIGKSSVAKAVINDDDIKEHYGRRFFVTFDGMDRTQMTLDVLIQRVASTLGLHVSGAECERQVKSNLKSSPVLLVLDNAETFEDIVDPDEALRIESFIADIANALGVSVILTSRTRNSARKVRWTRFIVPPLEKLPARQYLGKYTRETLVTTISTHF